MIATQLKLNAVTKEDRNEMIARVREAMAAGGAWILDTKQFSNVSICFNFEIPERKATRLRDELLAIGLRLMEDAEDSLAIVRDTSESGVPDLAGTLQITFIHNEPDLRIEVPPIPG